LTETDLMLYEAKEKGRACYAVKACARGGADDHTDT